MTRVRAWIGLGSNLDDPAARVRAALGALSALPQSRLGPVSGLYRSAPVGGIAQPDFCNAVAGLDTALTPHALLAALQAIEAAQQRVRTQRWGPRTLDLDILLYGDRSIATPDLDIPHPRMQQRAFVLVPLAEVAPALDLPGSGPVAALAAATPGEITPWPQ